MAETYYRVTAVDSRGRAEFSFYEDSDLSATWAAIAGIMDRAAASPTGPWALGEITLQTGDGRVLQTMDSKEVDQ